ncbi:MAG TPA: citrate/2-methylcitrate synthase [Streptosporangiaceae bacterium]|nr:citrate/2-methylcitrate synthase [Streptosporangiaceae bacterium]
MTEWIGAAEAARRLGIKQASLYSYVSRGVLSRRRSADGRGSLFQVSEVEGLVRRGRPRRPLGLGEIVIETELTEITGDHLRYRGFDAIALAATRSFEEVAGLLWTGDLGQTFSAAGWQATSEAVAAGTAAQSALPAGTLPLERLQVIVPAMAATDPLRLHLDRPAVLAAGRCLIAGMVECLPLAGSASDDPSGDGSAGDGSAGTVGQTTAERLASRLSAGHTIAERLASRLSGGQLAPGLTDALRAALVLVADHELAASTFAARVAASVRADPYAVVATGLGALGGSLHGGASLGAEMLLGSASKPADAARVVGDLLRRGERIPGFGHFVYQGGDPRAVLLLTMIRRAAPDSDRLAVAEAMLAEARRRALPEPNIDFALASLASVAAMIPGAGEAVFAIARAAGWLAHALEEYARNTPIRPRGIYTGPAAVTF